MVNKLDSETFTTEFESHWVTHKYDLLPHLNKKLTKLLAKKFKTSNIIDLLNISLFRQ